MSHLVPPDSVFVLMPHIASRELAVARWLGVPAGHKDILLTSTFSLPSFDADWAVFLMRTRAGQHYLQYVHAHVQIGSDAEGLKVERLTSNIEQSWAEQISAVICNALADVRYPVGDTSVGIDGTDFHFSASHPQYLGLLSGKTWSPKAETVPGQLVNLADGMRDFCMCSQEFQYRARARMRSAIDWLRAHQ